MSTQRFEVTTWAEAEVTKAEDQPAEEDQTEGVEPATEQETEQ